MLAYVFWHGPGDSGTEAYVESLAAFQAALSEAGVPGFLGASVHAVPALPWSEGAGYEDWYRVEGSAALDPLDEAAVSGARQKAHDAAAARSAWGTAGLYRLRRGAPVDADVSYACWLAKPPGVRYPEFFEALAPVCEATGGALWGRQMTLGPTPEFCLVSPGDPGDLPYPAALRVGRRRVWPNAGR